MAITKNNRNVVFIHDFDMIAFCDQELPHVYAPLELCSDKFLVGLDVPNGTHSATWHEPGKITVLGEVQLIIESGFYPDGGRIEPNLKIIDNSDNPIFGSIAQILDYLDLILC